MARLQPPGHRLQLPSHGGLRLLQFLRGEAGMAVSLRATLAKEALFGRHGAPPTGRLMPRRPNPWNPKMAMTTAWDYRLCSCW